MESSLLEWNCQSTGVETAVRIIRFGKGSLSTLINTILIASQITEAIQTSRRRLLMVIFYWFTRDSLGSEMDREQLIDRMLGKVALAGMPRHDSLHKADYSPSGPGRSMPSLT